MFEQIEVGLFIRKPYVKVSRNLYVKMKNPVHFLGGKLEMFCFSTTTKDNVRINSLLHIFKISTANEIHHRM